MLARGPGFALAAALLFGASTPFSKALLTEIDPLALAGLLYLSAGIGLFAVLAGLRMLSAAPRERRAQRADLPVLIGAVASGGVIAPALLMFGLVGTGAATASLLLNLEGLATMTIAWLVVRESVDRRLLLGAAAILAGAAVLGWQGSAALGWSALAIAAACVAWGIDNNLTRKLSIADPVQIAAIKGVAAGVVNCGLSFFVQGSSVPAFQNLAAAALIGFMGYGVSLVLFMFALRHIGAARTSAYFSTAPFMGAALSIIVLGDKLTAPLAVAGALMAVGVYLHLSERHDHEHVHAVIKHEHAHRHDEHHEHEHARDDPPGEPHLHAHEHAPLAHSHPHFPDLHHRHRHRSRLRP